ncbi:phage fiber-tail adaptor protein [Commensalibacter oyaizuii]|uniref:Collagen-like protein n=1 Tax=Commensalibacter oyaizuii TaxID=3043873 RepID=A0ABT6Q367_9PROT|nr:hypothetical protein [Commensalibacter sp. TBRC 16381]MDI2091465.1 hypothetical protein [Commensalibacter sp. TBRC 16381]
MTCGIGSQIVIIPSGCLGNKEIALQCKSPSEAVYYQFSLANRLASTDMITAVSAWPSDEHVGIDQVVISGQTFKARISGGVMNTKIGIRFLVTTRLNETREFDVTLPIAPAGIISDGNCGDYVIGNTGPQGEQGLAATITVGKVIPSDPDADPTITNVGTQHDAILDFVLPRGAVGPQGEQGDIGPQGIQGEQGIQGIEGKAGTQILLSNRDPVFADARENIIWLNDVSGDLFESVPNGNNGYLWNKSGNLKGEAGSIIYTGSTDPVYNTIYKNGDLYFNHTNNDLFSFSDKQWVKLSNLKGDQGTRGSLWFFGQEDPTPSVNYKELDSFLNTKTCDLFVYNGSNWQKAGNLKGLQGDTGPKGDKGDTGETGPQGEKGDNGIAGTNGKDGKDGTRIITSQTDPDLGSGPSNPNVLWINTQTWTIKRTIFNNDTWEWITIGNIKGQQGDQGLTGQDGKAATIQIGNVANGDQASVINRGTQNAALLDITLPKGEKGDAGSRWYSGNEAPSNKTGLQDPRGAPRPGDMYLYLNTQENDASTYILTNQNNWAGPLGTVTGPQGPKGDKGDIGQTGPQGEKGDTGEQGPQGQSYINDGSTDLNVKSINSDKGLVKTDGNGNLSIGNNALLISPNTNYSPAFFNFTSVNLKGNTFFVSISSDGFSFIIRDYDGFQATLLTMLEGNILYNESGITSAKEIKAQYLQTSDSKTIDTSTWGEDAVGRQAFSKTLKKPVWWDGKQWIDALGNAAST